MLADGSFEGGGEVLVSCGGCGRDANRLSSCCSNPNWSSDGGGFAL